MKHYKVMIDYKNFIPIDETELEKALQAWVAGGKALFNEGATNRIEAVLPDYHRMMGWNYGYNLTPEDYAEIGTSKDCAEAKTLLADTKMRLLGQSTERPKEISAGAKMLAEKMNKPTRDR